MVATIEQIIGKINPEMYSSNKKELLKEYKSKDKIPADKIIPKNLSEHYLGYDSAIETLEPLYFWIIDFMSDMLGLKVEKLVDNFISTPGSGHFSELGQRATIMQQQGTKILADINTVLRSVLNIIYDLKEFKIRLESYNDLKSDEKVKSEAASLSLKQIWMDKVDIQKGNSSVKAMGLGQAGFTTLIDAFLAVKDEKDADKLDLNERVKRIIKPRIQEFNIWVKQSEKELKKRYELERTYLKSQVNSLKLYSRWARPYLRASQQLEMQEGGRNPALVKTFNTILLELTLLGKTEISMSPEHADLKAKRKYYSCVLVSFVFRGIPQRVMQQSHYAFGGRAEVKFQAYSLNEDELKQLDKELEKDDVSEVLKLIEGATTESLENLQEEINLFLDEKDKEEKQEKKKPEDTSNPFLALIGHYDRNEKNKEENKNRKEEKIKSETWVEKNLFRKVAQKDAIEKAFTIFNVYKKSHGMANFDKWI